MNSTAQVILRRAIPADLDGIAEVEERSFVHARERFSRKRVGYLIVNPRCAVTVAIKERKLLGWAAGLVWTRGKTPWGRVYALAVHPDAQGQRLGQRLLHDIIDQLRSRGGRKLFLEVRADNTSAVRLYEKAGFVICKPLPNYYGPGIGGVRMVLEPPRGPGCTSNRIYTSPAAI
jgi:ribosomal-protein-alanine N-acetyltransferase